MLKMKIILSLLVLFSLQYAYAQNAANSLSKPSSSPSPQASAQATPSLSTENTQLINEANFPAITNEIKSDFIISNLDKLSGRIAFSAEISGYNRILMLDLDAKILRVLIDGPGSNFFPSWSPDGTKLSFTSNRDGNEEIYVADWDGANPRRITNNNYWDDNPTWSSDGLKIYFSSEPKSGVTNIFSVNLDGSELTQITNFKGKNSIPRVSPDGRYVSYSTNRFWPGWDICAWDMQNKNEVCSLQDPIISFSRGDWSHSGNHLAFSYGLLNDLDIGIYNNQAGTTDKITKLPGREYDAVWGPKDREIAFVAEANSSKNIFNLFIADIGAEKDFQILAAPYSMRYLSWSSVRTIELEAKRISDEEKLAAEVTPSPTTSATPTLSLQTKSKVK